MTFSDSRIVEELQKNWTPVWERVSPVKEVTFELGEGREVKGTVGGEIAIYFCDEKGQVFDILPALQSPAATLQAMQRAKAFYDSKAGVMDSASVAKYHRVRMRATLEEIYKKHPKRFPKPFDVTPELDWRPQGKSVEQVPAQKIYPGTAKNEAHRQMVINMALDEATREMRFMIASKVAAVTPSEGKITVVEPGGRGYYMWQVGQAFCGKVPDRDHILDRVNYPQEEWPVRQTPNSVNAPRQEPERVHPLAYGVWNAEIKQPKDWQRLLFEGILYQPLGGGKFKYDSESLEALSIIED